MTTGSAVIGGLKLVYEKEGSGPPLVFLPGAFCSAIEWERTVPYLMDTHTCFVFEPRGHGRSDRAPDGDYRLATNVEEAVTFLREVVSEPAVLVGHSRGGLTAFGVAKIAPEMVRAVYSEDAAPTSAVAEDHSPQVAGIYATLTSVTDCLEQRHAHDWGLAQFANALARAMPVLADADPAALVNFSRMAIGTDPVFGRQVVGTDPSHTRESAESVVRALRCPVHIAQGDPAFGGIVSDFQLDEMRANGVNLTSTYFAGASHMISATQLKLFLADLKAFLARVS